MKSLYKLLLGVFVMLALLLSMWPRSAPASPGLINPRMNRLESEVRSLQSQVDRLQSQLPRVTSTQTIQGNPLSAPDDPSFDQQFDTLAILIIELQQRVSTLEATLEATTEFSQ